MPDEKRATVAAAIGVYNLVQNLLLPRAAYVPANLAMSAGLVALARRYGCSWGDLGLDPADFRIGARLGSIGAGVAGGAVLVGAAHPSTRKHFLDERARGQAGPDLAYQSLVRFPLGTALFEEVAFRGVVFGVWRCSGSSRPAAAAAEAGLFALWHLIPTWRELGGNPVGSRLASGKARVGAALSGAALTGVAALGFDWMRERTGSLVAPWLTHTVFNVASYLAGALIWRLSRS